MEKSYKFRLYPSSKQEELIQKTFGSCRFIFNHYLSKKIDLYKNNKLTMSYNECSSDLTLLKKELTWLNDIDCTALQSSLKDLDRAYKNFFTRIKKGNSKCGYPKFKTKKNNKKSYRSYGKLKLKNNSIRLPKLGYVKCIITKNIDGRFLSSTISQTPDKKYFISILCTDIDVKYFEKTNNSIGIDLGIKHLATMSDGNKIENPKYFLHSENKLAKLQRQLSRKQKDSKNRSKARLKVARMHKKISNQRNDFLQKQTTKIITKYDNIYIEDLQIKNMVKNHTLSKAISDVSWGEFIRQLEYKAKFYDKNIIRINRFFPSTQNCSVCGYKNKKLKDLSIRVWKCPHCLTEHDRDFNASVNILNEGIKQ